MFEIYDGPSKQSVCQYYIVDIKLEEKLIL